MAWYAVHHILTGQLMSVGQVIADPMPTDRIALLLADRPADSQVWDATLRQFVARPFKVLVDRLQDLITNPNYSEFQTAYNALSAPNRQRLANALARLLSRERFRAVGEPVELG
jgi:hypothetical protein